jgi:hypothetical protein
VRLEEQLPGRFARRGSLRAEQSGELGGQHGANVLPPGRGRDYGGVVRRLGLVDDYCVARRSGLVDDTVLVVD